VLLAQRLSKHAVLLPRIQKKYCIIKYKKEAINNNKIDDKDNNKNDNKNNNKDDNKDVILSKSCNYTL